MKTIKTILFEIVIHVVCITDSYKQIPFCVDCLYVDRIIQYASTTTSSVPTHYVCPLLTARLDVIYVHIFVGCVSCPQEKVVYVTFPVKPR